MIIECELTKEQYEEIKNAITFQDNKELGLYMYYGQKGNYKVKFSEDVITVLEVWEGIVW